MRTFFTKILSLILFSLTCTSTAFGAARAAAEASDSPVVAGSRAFPPLDLRLLSTFFPPRDNESLNIRLNKLSIIEADVYGVVAAEMAYKGAEHRADFHDFKTSEIALNAEYLKRIGVPAFFAGWKVVDILDTIPSDEERSVLAADQTDLFALTLEHASGFKLTTVRGTHKQSAHNLLSDVGLALNGTDASKLAATVAQKRYPFLTLVAGAAASFLPEMDALGSLKEFLGAYVDPTYVDKAVEYAGGAGSKMVSTQAFDKLKLSVEQVDAFLRKSESNAVVGHSLGGILVNSILRAREILGGDGAAMAKAVQYIGSFAGMGTKDLMPVVFEILGGERKSYKDSALCGADLGRYRELYRKLDAVGGSGKHIGTCVELESCLPAHLLNPGSAVAAAVTLLEAASVPTAVAAGGASVPVTAESVELSSFGVLGDFAWSAWSVAASAVSTAATYTSAAASYTAEAVAAPVKAVLEDHSCSAMMKELMMAYAYQKRVVIEGFLRAHESTDSPLL